MKKKSSNTSKETPKKSRRQKKAKGSSVPKPIKSHETVLRLNRPQQGNAAGYNSYWEMARASTPGGMRCRGREFVSTVYGTGTSDNYMTLSNYTSMSPNDNTWKLHPANFPRLGVISFAYEWYYFHNARLRFVPTLPTTQAGMYTLCVDFEANDTLPSGATGLLTMASNLCSVMSPVYGESSLEVPGSLTRLKKYVCDYVPTTVSSDSLIDQVVQAKVEGWLSVPTALSGTVIGYLQVDYDVEFYAPQVKYTGSGVTRKSDLTRGVSEKTTPLPKDQIEKPADSKPIKEAVDLQRRDCDEDSSLSVAMHERKILQSAVGRRF